MHIFITGGSGFIGKNLIPLLLAREHRLTCLLRDPQRLPEELRARVSVAVGDLTDLPQEVMEPLAEVEAVVHLAGRLWGRTRRDYNRVNRDGTAALAAALNRRRSTGFRRFVYLSSLAAVGPSRPGRPRTEQDPPRPVSHYGRSKLAGEKVLECAGFPWTILRPSTVYGPWDRATFLFFRQAEKGLSLLPRSGKMELSTVHAADVCQAVELALNREDRPRSTYFLNDGRAIRSLAELMKQVAEAMGARTRSVPLPAWLLHAAGGLATAARFLGLSSEIINPDKLKELRQRAWTCEAGLIEQRLGYQPAVPLERGLVETAAWYRDQGWL